MSRYPTPPQVERIGITETLQAPGIIPTEFRGNPLAGQLLAALGIAGDLAGQIGQNRRQNERDARMAENERRREDADLRREDADLRRDQRTDAAAAKAENQAVRGAGSEAGKRQAKIDAELLNTGEIPTTYDPFTATKKRATGLFNTGDPVYDTAAQEAYFDGMLTPALAKRTEKIKADKKTFADYLVDDLAYGNDPKRFETAAETAKSFGLNEADMNAMFRDAAEIAAKQPGGGETANSILRMMSVPDPQTKSKVGALLITTANAEKTEQSKMGNDRLATMFLAGVPHKELENEAIDLVNKGIIPAKDATLAITKSLRHAQGELSGLLNKIVNDGTMTEDEFRAYAARYISPSKDDPTYVPGETVRALENAARTRRLKDVEENWKQNIDAQMGPADIAFYEAGAGAMMIQDVTLIDPNGKEHTYTRESRMEAAMAAYAIKAEKQENKRADNAKGGPQKPNLDNVLAQVAKAAAQNGAPLTTIQRIMKTGADSSSLALLVDKKTLHEVNAQGYHIYSVLYNTMPDYLPRITDGPTREFYELVRTFREMPDFKTDESAILAAADARRQPPPIINTSPEAKEDMRQQISAKMNGGVDIINSIVPDVERYMDVYMRGGMSQEVATANAVELATLNVKVVNGVPIKLDDLHLTTLAYDHFVPVAQSIFAKYVKDFEDLGMTPANMTIRRSGYGYILIDKRTGYAVETSTEEQFDRVHISVKTLNDQATELENAKQAEAIQKTLKESERGSPLFRALNSPRIVP